MIEQNKTKLVEAFSGDFIQAKAIQEILEANNIDASLQNEYMAQIAPWQVSPGGFKPVKVIVKDSDLELALKLIEEFEGKAGED